MTKSKKIRILAILISLIIVGLATGYILITNNNYDSEKTDDEKIKIGFVITGNISDEGWNKMNYEGIKESAKEYNAELILKENVNEGTDECVKEVESLLEEKADMIILTSYGYALEAADLIRKNPDTAFYASSGDVHEKNVTLYTGRMYQARYLSGIIAGMKTKSNHIGYVAAMANNEVNRGINAFTLGVKSVNPDADVIVAWTDSWDDSEKEIQLTNKLIEDENTDVVTYHQNKPNVIYAAEKAGIYSIAYNEKPENVSDKCLVSLEWNFKNLYSGIIQEYKKGNSDEQDYLWLGIESDVVRLSELSADVSDEIREIVKKAETELIDGKEVFSGNIIDINGVRRCNENEIISDEQLLENQEWYVEGVEFYKN